MEDGSTGVVGHILVAVTQIAARYAHRLIGQSGRLATADLAGTHLLGGTFLADRQRIALVVHHVTVVAHCQICWTRDVDGESVAHVVIGHVDTEVAGHCFRI